MVVDFLFLGQDFLSLMGGHLRAFFSFFFAFALPS